MEGMIFVIAALGLLVYGIITGFDDGTNENKFD